MRTARSALAALALLLAAPPALANPAEVDRALPGAEKVGEASYRLLAVHLFDAQLYVQGDAFSWERPFALTLNYALFRLWERGTIADLYLRYFPVGFY